MMVLELKSNSMASTSMSGYDGEVLLLLWHRDDAMQWLPQRALQPVGAIALVEVTRAIPPSALYMLLHPRAPRCQYVCMIVPRTVMPYALEHRWALGCTSVYMGQGWS